MTQPTAAAAGLDIAALPSTSSVAEAPLTQSLPQSRLLDAWKPSERRRLGFLATRSYEQSGMTCPTDVWSYQQMFIEQQRDDANPWVVKQSVR